MSFVWPGALWFLAALPLLVVLYVLLLGRRKRQTLRISSLAVVREAAGRHGAWRRHVPPVLLLLALGTLALATARPTMALRLPGQQQTIVLAMDVSGSMRAADVLPNRLVAAQNAAKAFVQALPRNVRVGVVEFAGTAAIVQPPTENHAEVLASIDRFQLQRGTAIGSGIVLSLAAMFPEAGIELSRIARTRGGGPPPMGFGNDARESARAQAEFVPVPAGSYDSGAVILLTDGQRTTGPDPIDAAQMAADRGVKVYSVGIGRRRARRSASRAGRCASGSTRKP
jgi:Ca-activated chloride channel family protein